MLDMTWAGLARSDPDEFEPVRGRALSQIGTEHAVNGVATGTGMYVGASMKAQTVMPVWAAIRTTTRMANVIHVATGEIMDGPMEIPEAMRLVRDLDPGCEI